MLNKSQYHRRLPPLDQLREPLPLSPLYKARFATKSLCHVRDLRLGW